MGINFHLINIINMTSLQAINNKYDTSLQAQSRTAACPLFAYPNLKSIMMPPAKLVVYLC